LDDHFASVMEFREYARVGTEFFDLSHGPFHFPSLSSFGLKALADRSDLCWPTPIALVFKSLVTA
jgi:hypothetical protein